MILTARETAVVWVSGGVAHFVATEGVGLAVIDFDIQNAGGGDPPVLSDPQKALLRKEAPDVLRDLKAWQDQNERDKASDLTAPPDLPGYVFSRRGLGASSPGFYVLPPYGNPLDDRDWLGYYSADMAIEAARLHQSMHPAVPPQPGELVRFTPHGVPLEALLSLETLEKGMPSGVVEGRVAEMEEGRYYRIVSADQSASRVDTRHGHIVRLRMLPLRHPAPDREAPVLRARMSGFPVGGYYALDRNGKPLKAKGAGDGDMPRRFSSAEAADAWSRKIDPT